jgi:hypothetical protein
LMEHSSNPPGRMWSMTVLYHKGRLICILGPVLTRYFLHWKIWNSCFLLFILLPPGLIKIGIYWVWEWLLPIGGMGQELVAWLCGLTHEWSFAFYSNLGLSLSGICLYSTLCLLFPFPFLLALQRPSCPLQKSLLDSSKFRALSIFGDTYCGVLVNT